MSPRRKASLALACAFAIAAIACKREPPSPAPAPAPAPDPAPPASITASPPDASLEAGRPPAPVADDSPFLKGTALSAKAIGHTSIVFKIELSSGAKAAFKPASRRGPLRYKGEIAAYRLAKALEIPNVPRAFFRTLEASSLAAAKGADEMIVKDGVVKGALIPWIPDLSFLALEQAPLSVEWKQWLRRGAEIPEDKRALATQISTLVAFDYITGNWDRWSGGNVGLDKTTGTLLFIDNDGAFFEGAPQDGLQRNKKLLEGIDRFSWSLVTQLRYLTDEMITAAIGEESPGVPLLSQKALAAMFKRRDELLAVFDAKLKAGGEMATYLRP